jgi:SNF2 family DNA or RNA helicase
VVDLNPADRLDLTSTLMQEADGKAIVFVPYRHLCDMLRDRLNLPTRQIRVVNGSTNDHDRNNIFQDFQDPNSGVRYLIAHPACMAHGLNLTAANVIVWYAPLMSHMITEQANARITRAGQEREQIIYQLSASAAENKLYHTLEQRGSLQNAVLKLFETQFQ